MANTYTLINSSVLTGSQASVTFSSIPSTYTDLLLKISARGDVAGTSNMEIILTVNSLTSGYSRTYIYGNGSATASGRFANQTSFKGDLAGNSAGDTANTFGNGEWYLPNYTVSASKPMSVFAVSENNATLAFVDTTAGLNTNTAAITTITLATTSGNFVTNSSFWLYGIKNS